MGNWHRRWGNKRWVPNQSWYNANQWTQQAQTQARPIYTYLTNNWAMPAWSGSNHHHHGHSHGRQNQSGYRKWTSYYPSNAAAWTLPSYPSSWSNTSSWRAPAADDYKSWTSAVKTTAYTTPANQAASWSANTGAANASANNANANASAWKTTKNWNASSAGNGNASAWKTTSNWSAGNGNGNAWKATANKWTAPAAATSSWNNNANMTNNWSNNSSANYLVGSALMA